MRKMFQRQVQHDRPTVKRVPIWSWSTLVLLAAVVLAVQPAQAASAVLNVEPANIPDWVEPKGMNVVDLVGQVPESHLRDAIVGIVPGGSFLQYIEGQRSGDTVTVRTKVTPWHELDGRTRFSCLGARGFSDHFALAAPPSTLRIYQGTRDITDRIVELAYFPSGLIQPLYPAVYERYPEVHHAPKDYTESGALQIPAHMGCTIILDGRYEGLTAVFEFQAPQVVRVEVLGSESFSFRSYSGPGDPGKLGKLQAQLQNFIGNRHDKFLLNIPEGTDYVFVNFPPSGVNPYANGDIEVNIRRPSTGTYRLAQGEGTLSVDHQVSMGLPLHLQWQDADQARGEYLRRIASVNMLAAPEYFVPEGGAYDPCMREGGCPQALLDRLVNATMTMSIHYYRVSRAADGLVQVPLRQVGPKWEATASVAGAMPETSGDKPDAAGTVVLPSGNLYMPLVVVSKPVNLPPDDPEDCPCGWFTMGGRMVDYVMDWP